MTAGIARLVDLSRLRSEAAARAVARAKAVVAQTEAAIAAARRTAEDTARAAETDRARAREAFIGAPQSRLAVEDLLAGLSGLRAREASAQAAIVAAIGRRDGAATDLAKARALAASCEVALEKRRRAAVLIEKAARRRSELAAEAEGWQGGQSR